MAGKLSADTAKALELIEKKGLTPYAAAKQTGIALSTIYRALGRAQPEKRYVTEEELSRVLRELEKVRDGHSKRGDKMMAKAMDAQMLLLKHPELARLTWGDVRFFMEKKGSK